MWHFCDILLSFSFFPLGKVHPCAKGQQNACSAATDMKLKSSVSAQKESQPKHVLYRHNINYPASKRLKYTLTLGTALQNARHQQMYQAQNYCYMPEYNIHILLAEYCLCQFRKNLAFIADKHKQKQELLSQNFRIGSVSSTPLKLITC